MTLKCWQSVAIVSIAASLVARPAAAQLAPTGGHYPSSAPESGGGVNASGGYSASIPLDFPGARGGLPVPVAIVYGERGVGAAGLGWDVPLSYIRRDLTFAHRRPMGTDAAGPQARERVSLVLGGQSHELGKTASGWVGRRDAPDIAGREQSDGTWVMYDGQGRTYTFTTVSSALSGANLWLLKTITGVGGSRVELDYSITTPSIPGGSGLSIDLTTVSYNPHPTTASCFKTSVVLHYDTPAAAPLSLSMLGDRALVRIDKVDAVNVNSKATCSDSNVRLRHYELEYQQDVDTQLPRLHAVRLFGRDGTPEATTAIPVAYYGYGSATSGGQLQYARSGQAADGFVQPVTIADSSPPPTGGTSYSTIANLADLSGDGLPDLIKYDGFNHV